MLLSMQLPWITLVGLISLTLGIVAIISSFLLRSRQIALNNAISACINELRILASSSVGVGKRLIDMEHELQKLSLMQFHAPLTDTNRSTYHQATALLQKGALLEEVMSTCEISRAEAEFLYKISMRYV